MTATLSARDERRRRLEVVVRRVGDLARSLHGTVDPQYKGDGSPVTAADYALQEALVSGLEEAFPGDGIVSEEGVRRAPGDDTAGTWHVDPIDGTGAFLHGLAHWGPAVGRIEADGLLDVGVYYEPLLDRMFSAGRDVGAWCDGRRLPPAPTAPVARNDVLYVPSRIHQRPGLPWPGKLRCIGSTAAHLALVAAGGGRAAIVGKWSPWDVVCGLLLNREVGHVVRRPRGPYYDGTVPTEGLPFLVGDPTALDILDTGGWASGAMPAPGT